MKKKFSTLTLALFLIFTFVFAVPASAQQVTARVNGFTNVEFSNGYYGYCIDRDLHGAYTNDVFNTSDTSVAKSNVDASDISQYLKVFFTQYFEDLFVSDGNSGYVLDNDKKDSLVPSVVYHFSDGQYVWGTNKTYTDNVKAYSGESIPDEGYTKTLSNGDVITFYFMCLEPENNDQQTFFAYKFAVNETPSHTHEFDEENWVSDDDNHWHECECGEKKDVTPHDGNDPDCKNPSICEECEKELAPVDPDKHTGNTEIRDDEPASEFEPGYTGDTYCKDCGELLEKGEETPATHQHDFDEENWVSDDDNHWHECECGEKKDVTPHNFNDGVCEDCKEESNDANNNNNTNNDNNQNDSQNNNQNSNQNSDNNTNNGNNSGSNDNVNNDNKDNSGNNSSNNGQSNNPNTNNESYMGLLIALAFMSLSGIVFIKRKKNSIA